MANPLTLTTDSSRESHGEPVDRRQQTLIGAVGFFLPQLLVLIAAARPDHPADRWKLLPSISAYYYTGAVAAFVGLLVALALFLLAYQGYKNKWHALDVWTARIAALAAIGVAFFPTAAPDGYSPAPWWREWMGMAHYGSAIVLFCSFAFFSLFLFRRTDTPKSERGPRSLDQTLRNVIYLTSGGAILGDIVWAAIVGVLNNNAYGGVTDRPIFWAEAGALEAFAISWLVKGRALGTLWRFVMRLPTPAPAASR
jgi:hypothetical protein